MKINKNPYGLQREKPLRLTNKSAENLVKGTTLPAEMIKRIIDYPDLNKLSPEKFGLILNGLCDFMENTMPQFKPPGLRVWYGFTKLTPKVVRKPAIIILYENEYTASNDRRVELKMKVVYTRLQTEKEMNDCKNTNRVFTKYEYHINEKPWNGNLPGILFDNFHADSENISEDIRNEIKSALEFCVKQFYMGELKDQYQSSFNF